MDNNELDKILKEKLNGTIRPSKEFEEKMKNKVREEQEKAKASKFVKTITQEKKKINWASRFISVAAMLVIVFTAGVIITKDNNQSPMTIEESVEKVTSK